MDQKYLIIDAYGDYIETHMNDGWDGYLMSFMFNQLRGSREDLLQQMQREIERVYATFLTRVVRDPTHEKNRYQLPRWVVCPDLPVPKHRKSTLRDVTLNDGLHHHAIALQPQVSRLNAGVDQHFQAYQEVYVKPFGQLRAVTARSITSDPKYVVEYAFKAVTRRRASLDDLVILPRTLSEIRDQFRGVLCG